MSSYTIGRVAEMTGVSAKTIRYYESTGLLTPPERADNGYRVYGERAVHQLRFVKRARDLGFSVEDVGNLLALWADEKRESVEVKRLAVLHLAEIESKIAALEGLRATMRTLIECCHGDARPDCPILESLAAEPGEKL